MHTYIYAQFLLNREGLGVHGLLSWLSDFSSGPDLRIVRLSPMSHSVLGIEPA